ncbi:MAG: DUF86 domain-containing protein [Microcystis panniformis Mp_MB_F_20051200_S9]|uniref:DUF86 domain-containing protein n=1 Tax=Microcystis panniformis Mp_MB_F_20051200_S9 TaxID=2486223 RepID=A0A552Q106_9CHRO|nr:MAG: DUF86 domain-containing protein [Microcystis panniformis Mp_GB_SS_20050300_S99]TRV46874.1 MAG: DUF86 domain-containing protein [Microcystis panniformis Mp_GB_SS_20050300_S99D]TRV52390.1 MAG: DUF86 domain-containing protein [Microcystis panniformis Mp_MB_F_20080800_S26D]TRV61822.1 MAG: DUF86 domain-containing protein [Microcystis panniformis Mp_MB_F_20080800_S26]TRV62879.1 MAG: DUF86 domain-containing protein [Microcystis panniformis Mp_MB_F_20051200_S9]TRV64574.1 MAG: DUF86 domain-cont
MNRNLSYLLDINEFIQDLLQFVENMDESAFLTDKKTQNAVLYNITIIGEAVKKLTPDFREQHPQIPWKQIAGMRDKLVHDYRQINLKQVWLVTQTDIPELIKNLEPLLPKQED